MAPLDVSRTFDWLVDGAPGARTPMDVIGRMCAELVEAGVALDRFEAFVRTLHPHIAGRSFRWTPGAPVEVIERSFSYLTSPEFTRSAVGEVFATGQMARRLPRMDDEEHPDLSALAREGYTDFAAAPMRFMSGTIHAVTFATRRPGGFTDDDKLALVRVLAPLSRVGEILALLRTATNLLNTYVGNDAGERILAGQIQRGDIQSLQAVIWFSDLRGFTSMSSALEPRDIIGVLNDVFDCQVPAIDARGGQVLKFMGDGMLAIFPVKDDVRGACDRALAAARASMTALQSLNQRRAQEGQAPVRFGVALHLGDIAYGNIGGSGRLDFTCIGAAVNLAARLETLTGKLGRDIVVSAEVARQCGEPMESLGSFELKGVNGAAEAFAPRP